MAVERSSKLDLFTFQRRLEKADMRSLRVATSKTIHLTSSKLSLIPSGQGRTAKENSVLELGAPASRPCEGSRCLCPRKAKAAPL
ncbi:hypothetical protein TcasGA2_TC007040 [Tribolium castaneum]|uniref:Uncharacterized protein n=1 Tax=Tribolium castaneum TaxID=7070 RepID=D2A251_TRICA|nr:hypothetical protein TcasGA2_TC007040 [Tribolium castaneum]